MKRINQTRLEVSQATRHGVVNIWAQGRGKGKMAESTYAAWENPDREFDPGNDDDFKIVVPFSGGLDSFAAATMSVYAGFDPDLVYVDTGVGYSPLERSAAELCAAELGRQVRVVERPVEYVHHEHHDLARNLIIVWLLAAELDEADQWGELWFGNTAEWGEMPVKGGDKAFRFFGDAQALLYAENMDVRISNPVGGMSKADIVRYLVHHHGIDIALSARSCYSHTDPGQCGECLCCFKRYLAFHSAGYPEVHDTYTTLGFQPLVDDFMLHLNDQNNVIYSGIRMAEPLRILSREGWIA